MTDLTEETALRLLEFVDTANTIAELREQRNKYMDKLTECECNLDDEKQKTGDLEKLLCAAFGISRESLWERRDGGSKRAWVLMYNAEWAAHYIAKTTKRLSKAREAMDRLERVLKGEVDEA